jgi:ADP-ribose pyrophosphatase YjhB (NUDIX family)
MKTSIIKHFNIRVYGIYINKDNEVLLADEYQLDTRMTKFPGGGMKFGEGPADCLKREAIEEFGQEIEIIRHFYTTDFFQRAQYYNDHQLISIYYLMKFKWPVRFKISTKAFDFQEDRNGNISFRFLPVQEFKPTDLTFPIDRVVARMIIEEFTS